MRSERNTIPPESAAGGSQALTSRARVLPAATTVPLGLSAMLGALEIGVALNRAEDELPAGAELAVCFLAIGADLPTELELIPAGKFKGRDGRAWNNDQPDQVVALSEKIKLPVGYCIDVDHALDYAANEKVGGEAPAYGWISTLENRGGAIWGKVDWTELGANAVKGKTYRGLSPVFAFDKETGRVLAFLSASLTNKPNLVLTAFNSRQAQTEKSHMDWLKKLLGLEDAATDDQVKAAINAFIALAGTLAGAIGVDLKAALALNAESLQAALGKKFGASDVLVALCTKAGVKADATAEAILVALQSQSSDPAKFVPMAAHLALKEQLDKIQGAKPAELVEQALNDGRLYPAQKDWALAYAQRDLEGFKKYIGATPNLLPNARTPAGGGGGEHGLTEHQLAICTNLGLDPKAYAETLKSQPVVSA